MRFLELRVPPPLVAALAAGLMWLFANATPGWSIGIPGAVWIAAALAAFGLSLDLAGIVAFARAKTSVNPMDPRKTRALVTGGVYAWSRNPMYLGWIPILAGWAILLGHLPSLAVIPLFVAYLTRFQIIPEERVLSEAFGEAYLAYRQRVGRWL